MASLKEIENEDDRDDLLYELEDLLKALTHSSVDTYSKLRIMIALVKERCDPGVIREIATLTTRLIEDDQSLHILQTPEMQIRWSYFDCYRDPDLKFKDALLIRLAQLRMSKMRDRYNDITDAQIHILEGDDHEY
eukprot:TRINITY_DN5427_c0_g1_i3.p1 TRINITY_DN5427_c0_g1~~TRINITY_DN5427_c0_g1_i3.p1  ORF type:complete len:135 (-),score=18.92 TRINITY_DN5427_c0_g1_i3:4-408(-)